MRKALKILRLSDFEDLIDSAEDAVPFVEPPQTTEFSEGMQAGLNLARMLAERISYEAYEYDLGSDEPMA